MKEYPLITCYMLTYNKFQHMYEALDSVLQQTYPKIELLILDDCSSQFPKEQIEQYIIQNKRDNIVKVSIIQNETNLGTVRNTNNMLKNASGKYLLGAGIDDVLYDKDVFMNVVNYFEETNAKIVTCYKVEITQEGNMINKSPSPRMVKKLKKASAEKMFKMVAMGVAVAGAGTYYARSIFEESGVFDEKYRLQEDGTFFLRVLREGFRIEFLDIIAVKYRQGEGVSSGKELHPDLKIDINNMLQNEIVPYLDKFGRWEKRCINYQIERFKMPKQLLFSQMLKLCLKYPDVIIYRRLMAK